MYLSGPVRLDRFPGPISDEARCENFSRWCARAVTGYIDCYKAILDPAHTIPVDFDLIVSLQAVHELRHAGRIPRLYAQLFKLLVPGGSLLICDHVNSSSPSGHRAAHFMTVEEHLSTVKEVGFIKAREICPAADLSLMGAEMP